MLDCVKRQWIHSIKIEIEFKKWRIIFLNIFFMKCPRFESEMSFSFSWCHTVFVSHSLKMVSNIIPRSFIFVSFNFWEGINMMEVELSKNVYQQHKICENFEVNNKDSSYLNWKALFWIFISNIRAHESSSFRVLFAAKLYNSSLDLEFSQRCLCARLKRRKLLVCFVWVWR